MAAAILEKINHLPKHLQDDVEQYVDFLMYKHFSASQPIPSWLENALDKRKEECDMEKDKAISIQTLKQQMKDKYGI